MQLIADDVENNSSIADALPVINSMKKFINNRLSKDIGIVPSEVETRWFSKMNTVKFLIMKQHEIIELRNELLKMQSVSSNDKKSLTDIFDEKKFDIINKYALTMLPIYSATLYFNSNNAKAADIIPVVFQIKEYWEDLDINEDFEDFYDVINLLLERLRHRLFHLKDLPLLYLIYSLTPGGRIFERKMLKKYSY